MKCQRATHLNPPGLGEAIFREAPAISVLDEVDVCRLGALLRGNPGIADVDFLLLQDFRCLRGSTPQQPLRESCRAQSRYSLNTTMAQQFLATCNPTASLRRPGRSTSTRKRMMLELELPEPAPAWAQHHSSERLKSGKRLGSLSQQISAPWRWSRRRTSVCLGTCLRDTHRERTSSEIYGLTPTTRANKLPPRALAGKDGRRESCGACAGMPARAQSGLAARGKLLASAWRLCTMLGVPRGCAQSRPSCPSRPVQSGQQAIAHRPWVVPFSKSKRMVFRVPLSSLQVLQQSHQASRRTLAAGDPATTSFFQAGISRPGPSAYKILPDFYALVVLLRLALSLSC